LLSLKLAQTISLEANRFELFGAVPCEDRQFRKMLFSQSKAGKRRGRFALKKSGLIKAVRAGKGYLRPNRHVKGFNYYFSFVCAWLELSLSAITLLTKLISKRGGTVDWFSLFCNHVA